MTLFFSLLPLYIFGNIHCMGMCGPIVMLLGQHRYRFFYFLGRLSSFSLAGFVAGEIGAVLHVSLKHYFLAEMISLGSGIFMMGWGMQKIFGKGGRGLNLSNLAPLNFIHRWSSMLLLKDQGWSTFLFGFFTVALPCGQTLLVFSACALAGNAWVGLGNGFAFALLTTPSLVIAMHTLRLFKKYKHYDRGIMGGCAITVGLLAFCRGLAEVGIISHWVINPEAESLYHFVIY